MSESSSCETCVICQEDFCESKKHKITLQCGHKFHKTCAREWLKSNASCPMCRSFTTGKITRNISSIYYLGKISKIVAESFKLYIEENPEKKVDILTNILKIYLNNPYIFVNSKETSQSLKNMLVTTNDIIITGVTNDTKNLDILNKYLMETQFMLRHIC